jgi:hypothetical protein
MKYLILILLCSQALFAQTLEEDKTKLLYLKTVEWPKAYREQDTVLLNRLLADEFQIIEASGDVSTKRAEMEYIKKHKPSYKSFVYTIQRLEIFENGTAIVSGIGTIQGADKEGAYGTTYASSNVLIKRNGQWQAIASHVSGVKKVSAQSSVSNEFAGTLDLYVEGLRKGDINLLNSAFAADGQFCYLVKDKLTCKKFSEVLSSWVKQPDAKVMGKIMKSDVTGNMGLATYELKFGGNTFRDILTLYKIENTWKIITKTTFIVKP